MSETALRRVLDQLALYEHPLLEFGAQARGEGVEVTIRLKHETPGVHPYTFEIHPRDLQAPQFDWQFQRQLYDCLHDYLVEMFTRSPQSAENRR